ncbi:MAG: phosphoadenosine phosphosulfate reductase [Pseudomonadota bacterium]
MIRPKIDFGPSLGELTLDDWLEEVAELVREDGSLTKLSPRHYAVLSEHGSTLMVSFETLDSILALSPLAQPLGWDMARRLGWSTLSLISRGETWFREESVFEYIDALSDDGFFDEFDTVLFYGAGSGAHAAAAFSVAAPGARVLCIQPQATLDPLRAGWDTRFAHMRRTDFHSRYGYAPDMIDAAEAACVIFDPLEREDAMHASLFHASHVMQLPMHGMGAALASDLWQMGVLHDTIAQTAAGTLTRSGFARALRARRGHLPYLHRLLRRLERDDRDALIQILCRNVTARLEAPRFRQRLKALSAAQ